MVNYEKPIQLKGNGKTVTLLGKIKNAGYDYVCKWENAGTNDSINYFDRYGNSQGSHTITIENVPEAIEVVVYKFADGSNVVRLKCDVVPNGWLSKAHYSLDSKNQIT